ncbi:hypothetical protein V2J09_022677 [Rumex salicifolius]
MKIVEVNMISADCLVDKIKTCVQDPREMDENEFQRLLSLFPVVRTRDYHGDFVASSSQSTSYSGKDEVSKWQQGWNEDSKNDSETKEAQVDMRQYAFWDKLKLAAEKKLLFQIAMALGKQAALRVFYFSPFTHYVTEYHSPAIGEAETEKFCISFRKVYQKLVHEGMSEEAAQRYIK